ncbi:MAG: CHAT domain-containing protein [Bacteroidota bacterium]
MDTPETVLGSTLQETPPVILLGRANTYQDGKRLKRVQEESTQIASIFQQSEAVSHQVLKAQPEDGVYLFDQLRHFRFLPSLQVLHIAGFSAGEYFHLEGGWGEEALSPEDFAQLLGKLPNLQVVFLSGCATNALLEALLPLNIPLILATQTEHDRRIVEDIAAQFYQLLAQGQSIKACVQQLEAAFPEQFTHKRVFYQLEQDRFIWDGKGPNSVRKKLEWGGYGLQEISKGLDWCLPAWDQELMNVPASQPASPTSGKRSVRWGVLLFLLLGGVTGFGAYAYTHLDWQSWFQLGRTDCEFTEVSLPILPSLN